MNLQLLYDEKKFVNHQFPTVTVAGDPPTVYEGLLRCEKGEVKKLAEKNIWPFTEYVSWHKFKLELPNDYPLTPPKATWLTDIAHPNIVPNIPGAVCISILGEGWRPDLKIVSVINALYYLLSDPNPDNVFDHPRCLEAAEICRKYGFPKHRGERKEEETVRFNIIPIPTVAPTTQDTGDILRFKLRDMLTPEENR
jgi:hypothetical protein